MCGSKPGQAKLQTLRKLKAMSTLRTILFALMLAALIGFMLWAYTTGPDLLEIIDNPKL